MTHVALLHAVNLGQKRKVPMPELKALFVKLGLESVQTYIQSGNVIFTAPDDRELKAQLELALAARFGFDIPVTLRTAEAWQQAIQDCPPDLLSEKVSVGFLGAEPAADAVAKLYERDLGAERWQIVGQHLYQTVPEGTKNLKLSHALIERVLRVSCTVRNWNTTRKIAALL